MADETQTTPTEPTPEPVESPATEPSVPSSEPIPEVPENMPVSEPETVAEPTTPASEEPAEPVAETPKVETAQTGGTEPLSEPTLAQPEPVREEKPVTKRDDTEAAKPVEKTISEKEKLGLLRQMARATIQLRREKKLAKIMALFAKQTAVTNDEVEKLLHVSDATATRYLSILAERGKLKQVGHTGRGVRYERQ